MRAAERERNRRESLARQIETLKAKLDGIGPSPVGLARARAWGLINRISRLKYMLAQSELKL